MTVYYFVLAAFILIASGNVTWQVWAPAFRNYPAHDCRAGVYELARGVERARQAAGAVAEEGEQVALDRFRAALSPEWDDHDAIAHACRAHPELSVALDAVERLRYAEERAVRREVSELAPLRRKVGKILANQLDR
jgi:hypothetical protein